ncbi:MAG: GyrI-like domain-containing protein [Turicibacter sp.]|nr:GyrI-like domain-containing protein [Turicibacter sp.]
MKMRLEERAGFTISGYLIETLTTDESYDEKSMALRQQYEGSLRTDTSVLYGATWFTNDEKLFYLFGVEQENNSRKDSVIIPAGLFAVATVPKEMPLIQAWVETWEEDGLPAMGCDYIEGEVCFELFREDGIREIWVPVRIAK